MGSENLQFDALVIASVGGVLGVAYLLGAMLSLLSSGGTNVLLLAGSVPFTAAVGVLLSLSAGLLSTGHRFGRYLGILTFGAIGAVTFPSLSSPGPFVAGQAGLSFLLALYMVVRNPVPKTEKSKIDESTSATRVGSTIR